VVFTSLMTLEQIGIQTTLITNAVQIILASFGLALAIAMGLGGKEIMADFLKNTIGRKDSK
jgi:hypothetical protein